MAIFYGLCDSVEEKEKALAVLLDEIHKKNDHMGVGVLGGRVIFRVLCEGGYKDLAIKMIIRPDVPSYGYMIDEGMTTLAEFLRPAGKSLNHHFWGFVYTFFTKYVAGLIFNPNANDITYAEVKPTFIAGLTHAETSYEAPLGKIFVKWEKKDRKTFLSVTVPKGMKIKLFVQGKEELLEGGAYRKVYNAI